MTIRIDILIIFYMVLLIALIGFNVIYLFYSSTYERAGRLRLGLFPLAMRRAIALANGGRRETMDFFYSYYMGLALRRKRNLLMFEDMIDEITSDDLRDALNSFFEPLFIGNIEYIEKRDSMSKAFFARLVMRFKYGGQRRSTALITFLLQGTDDPSLICRDSCLKAVITIGDEKDVLAALRRVNESERYFYPKVILQVFNCVSVSRQDELLEYILPHIKDFKPFVRVAMIKLARKINSDRYDVYLHILRDPEYDIDTHIECVRYFGKMVYEPAREELLHILTFQKSVYRKMIVFALWALKDYYDDEVKEKAAALLDSRETDIQEAACELLLSNGMTYYELIEYYNSSNDELRSTLNYMRERIERGELLHMHH